MPFVDIPRHVVVSEQEPEAKDWLGKDVEHSVGDDLAIDADVAGAVSDAPDTVIN